MIATLSVSTVPSSQTSVGTCRSALDGRSRSHWARSSHDNSHTSTGSPKRCMSASTTTEPAR